MFKALLPALLLTAPLAAATPAAPAPHAEQHHKRVVISTDELKALIGQHKEVIVLDARSKEYFDGKLLPTAKWLPHDSSDKDITAAAPAKDKLVVVYCAGVKCPASGMLYDKLTAMGYTNVKEYHEGIAEWVQKGYPTTAAK